MLVITLTIALSFNPLPPPKRGETTTGCRWTNLYGFQSTPPAEARGDLIGLATVVS